MEKDLSLLEKKIKYKFKDISLLKLALTHSSFEKTLNNENLEFLGDRVLGLVIAEKLIKDYPSADEGSLDKMLSSLVNRNTCFMVANNLALGDFILLGSTERSSLGNKKKSILSIACESILGAVYRDSDFVIVKKLILELWREHIHNIDQNLITNIKVFDVYEGENIPENQKSVAINLTIQSPNKTLNDNDLEKINKLIIETVEKKTGAKIRS